MRRSRSNTCQKATKTRRREDLERVQLPLSLRVFVAKGTPADLAKWSNCNPVACASWMPISDAYYEKTPLITEQLLRARCLQRLMIVDILDSSYPGADRSRARASSVL